MEMNDILIPALHETKEQHNLTKLHHYKAWSRTWRYRRRKTNTKHPVLSNHSTRAYKHYNSNWTTINRNNFWNLLSISLVNVYIPPTSSYYSGEPTTISRSRIWPNHGRWNITMALQTVYSDFFPTTKWSTITAMNSYHHPLSSRWADIPWKSNPRRCSPSDVQVHTATLDQSSGHQIDSLPTKIGSLINYIDSGHERSHQNDVQQHGS